MNTVAWKSSYEAAGVDRPAQAHMARNAYPLTNRQKAKQAKRGLFWCGGCDRTMVGQVGKCRECGRRENRKKTRN